MASWVKGFLQKLKVLLHLGVKIGFALFLAILGGVGFWCYQIGVNELALEVVNTINSNYGYIHGGEPVVIQTPNGEMRGFRSSSRDGRPFLEFLGIPFAEPPIGNLRFEPPVPVKPWEGIREARSFAAKCAQYDPFVQVYSGNEDCLYLNVFTPKVNLDVKDAKLPVIVFIHGGLFMFGRAELFRPDYMMDQDVILVTIHYRLGVLGFLNTGDGVVRGNMGLKDQVLALKWIQNNIHAFGGDPNSVTLLGESAGGASIHYHMMSNLSKGLFHRAISMSGTAMAHWAFLPRPKDQAKSVAEKLNCSTETTQTMITCLKNLKLDQIFPLYKTANDRLVSRLSVFVPTVEGVTDSNTMVKASPQSLLANGEIISKVPWLTGVNSHEGLIYAFSMLLNKTCVDEINNNWNKHAPVLFDYENLGSEKKRDAISAAIKAYYMGEDDFQYGTGSLEKFVPMFSDSSFNAGLVETINAHLKLSHNPIYLYYYAYKSHHGIAQIYFNMNAWFPLVVDALITNAIRWIGRNVFGYREKHYGASHADELPMLFQFPFVLGRVGKDSEDYEFSKKVVHIWTTFAKNGSLATENEGLPPWPPASLGSVRKYMKIDKEFELITEPFTSRLNLWEEIWNPRGRSQFQ